MLCCLPGNTSDIEHGNKFDDLNSKSSIEVPTEWKTCINQNSDTDHVDIKEEDNDDLLSTNHEA